MNTACRLTKFFSIDIETLGLALDAPIIQFGCVAFQGEETLGEFEIMVQHEVYHNVEPYAASMHPELWKRLAEGEGVVVDLLGEVFMDWAAPFLEERELINFCGKNAAGFDLPMLRHQSETWAALVRHHHRVFDIGSYMWGPLDQCVPNLQECARRAGLVEDKVEHTALADARLVAQIIMEMTRQLL